MLSYEHLCSMLTKLSYSETKDESMPKYVQIVSGGVAGRYITTKNCISHIK